MKNNDLNYGLLVLLSTILVFQVCNHTTDLKSISNHLNRIELLMKELRK